jgi:hypothetical protein
MKHHGFNSRDQHFPANHSALSRWLNAKSSALETIGCKATLKRDNLGSWVTLSIPKDTHVRLSRRETKEEQKYKELSNALEVLHRGR